jgi:hypothetical protein
MRFFNFLDIFVARLRYSRLSAYFMGWIDGKFEIPDKYATFSGYEHELERVCKDRFDQGKSWRDQVKTALLTEVKTAQFVQEQFAPRLKDAENEKIEAEKEANDVRQKYEMLPTKHGMFGYLFLLSIFFVLEVPFNYQAFEYITRDIQIVAIAIVGMASIAPPIVSHYVGKFLNENKDSPNPNENKDSPNPNEDKDSSSLNEDKGSSKLKARFLIVCVIGVFLLVAYYRFVYLARVLSNYDLPYAPHVTSALYVILQITVFTIAIQKAIDINNKERIKLRNKLKNAGKRVKEADKDLGHLKRAYGQAVIRQKQALTQIANLNDQLLLRFKGARNKLEQLAQTYRTKNSQNRVRSTAPEFLLQGYLAPKPIEDEIQELEKETALIRDELRDRITK